MDSALPQVWFLFSALPWSLLWVPGLTIKCRYSAVFFCNTALCFHFLHCYLKSVTGDKLSYIIQLVACSLTVWAVGGLIFNEVILLIGVSIMGVHVIKITSFLLLTPTLTFENEGMIWYYCNYFWYNLAVQLYPWKLALSLLIIFCHVSVWIYFFLKPWTHLADALRGNCLFSTFQLEKQMHSSFRMQIIE